MMTIITHHHVPMCGGFSTNHKSKCMKRRKEGICGKIGTKIVV